MFVPCIIRHSKNDLQCAQLTLMIYSSFHISLAYYSGTKIFNNLPLVIKNVADNTKKG